MRALLLGTRNLILIHNHPSRIAEPSDTDTEFTRQIVIVTEALSIRLLDHVIVAGGGFYSFRREKRL